MQKIAILFILILLFISDLSSQERARWVEIKTDIHPKGRADACMAQFESGKVLMFGGEDVQGYFLNDTWLFDVETSKWTQIMTKHAPTARDGCKMVKISDDKIVLFGGRTDSLNANNDLWFFDFKTMDWQELFPNGECEKRTKHSMAKLAEGRLLIFGGSYWGSNGSLEWKKPYIIYYDINSNQWSDLIVDYFGDPIGNEGAEMLYLNDNTIFLFGGARDKFSNAVNIFNLNNEKGFRWTKNISKNDTYGRYQFGISKLNSNIVVFGGIALDLNNNIPFERINDTWIFNLNDSSWKEIQFNNKPENRYLHSMCELSNNKALMYGGMGKKDEFYEDTWIFEFDSLVTDVQYHNKDENNLKTTLINFNEIIIENINNSNISFELFNYLGQIVPYTINDESMNQIRINFENKNNQLLFFKIQNNNQIYLYSIFGDKIFIK